MARKEVRESESEFEDEVAEVVPVDEVLRMRDEGLDDTTIIKKLREVGYMPKEINDAFNQIEIRESSRGISGKGEEAEEEMAPSIMTGHESYDYPYVSEEGEAAEEAPVPGAEEAPGEYVEEYETYPTYPTEVAVPEVEAVSRSSVQEIAEEIIDEKWQEFKEKVGDIASFRHEVKIKLNSLNERLKRLESAIDKVQTAMLGRAEDYGKDIRALGTEVKALETAFSKILEPLTTNVKELSSVTKKIKEAKKRPTKKEKKVKRKKARPKAKRKAKPAKPKTKKGTEKGRGRVKKTRSEKEAVKKRGGKEVRTKITKEVIETV